MRDTSPQAQKRYSELLRQRTPAEKLRSVSLLSAAIRQLALAGIREQYPGTSGDEQRALLARRLYGDAARR